MISFNLPKKLVFGNNCFEDFIEFFIPLGHKKVLIVVDPYVEPQLDKLTGALDDAGTIVTVINEIANEPTIDDFEKWNALAKENSIDAVLGIGGGSVLDMAKLIAAFAHSEQTIESAIGIGKLDGRGSFLACLPTTAGTGSEVSPNAILLDESDNLKKGIVSPFLVPDWTFVDAVFTYTVPPSVTASTGIDALTHCIEAYTNKFAHPVTDLLALEGIRLIYNNLENACKNGKDAVARENVALGSLYGGLCLGPVNTAAVHALSYPLGGEYHIPHGVSNALLLAPVLRANLQSCKEKFARMGRAIGACGVGNDHEAAEEGIQKISDLCHRLGLPDKLSDFGIQEEDIPKLAKSAIKVQRLLKNNPRDLSESDIREIYSGLF